MKIDLVIIDEEAYFSILINEQLFDTSKKISKLLNLDIDLYNKILIEKVSTIATLQVIQFLNQLNLKTWYSV